MEAIIKKAKEVMREIEGLDAYHVEVSDEPKQVRVKYVGTAMQAFVFLALAQAGLGVHGQLVVNKARSL